MNMEAGWLRTMALAVFFWIAASQPALCQGLTIKEMKTYVDFHKLFSDRMYAYYDELDKYGEENNGREIGVNFVLYDLSSFSVLCDNSFDLIFIYQQMRQRKSLDNIMYGYIGTRLNSLVEKMRKVILAVDLRFDNRYAAEIKTNGKEFRGYMENYANLVEAAAGKIIQGVK